MFAFMLTSQFKTKNSDYIGKATYKLDSRPEDSKVDIGNEKKKHLDMEIPMKRLDQRYSAFQMHIIRV